MDNPKVNVASRSTSGHYVEGAKRVIPIDENKDYFFVEGKSILTTKNHTTLEMKKDCLVFPQKVVNPLTGLLERVRD